VHYWRFGGSDPAMTTIDGADEEGEKALGRLQGLLLRYADPNQPFLSKPRVKFLNAWDEHDHFARRAEWADAGGEGGG
jgi:ATP-dependent helicase/nuclease subunit B